MGIPLKEAMRIYPFSRARLIAGERGIDREVESANIQEVPNVERWMRGGEILFSAGYAFQAVDSGIQLMEHINRLGAAALALKPGQCLDKIPEDMIACAERLGLPLFELPEDLPYMDCIIPIFERLSQKQLSLLRRVEHIHDQIMQAILRKEGLEGICAILSQVARRPVLLFSPKGDGVLASYVEEDAQAYVERIKELFGRSRAARDSSGLRANRCNTLHLAEGQTAICIPILVQEERVAYLLLDGTGGALPEMDTIAFEHTSALIAIEILKEQALVEQEQKIREKLLEDLLMKRYGDERMIYRRGLSVGIDLEKPYCVFVIDPDDFEAFLRREQSGSTEDEIQCIKARIHTVIRTGMLHFPNPFLLMNNSVSVVGLVSVLQGEDMGHCKDTVAGILQRLKEAYPKLGFSAGMGRVKDHIRDADASLREAKLALNCSRLPQFRRQGGATAFGELGALSFLCELSGSGPMQEYYREHVGALLAYDAEHNAGLVSTLECYFQCNQNLRLTAEKLFIHKNSVIYRLKKVESLLGISLSHGPAAFDLQMCLLLRNIL